MKFFISILTFVLSSVVLAETIKVQFEEIPHLVKERNQHVKGAILVKESSMAAQGYLKRSYLPSVEAKVGAERFQTGTQLSRTEPYGKVEATMNLFRGGLDKLQDEIVEVKIKAASAEADLTTRDEIKKARYLFWQLVSLRELEGLLNDAIAENQKNLASAQGRIREGLASQTDRIDFEMRRIEINQDLARLKLSERNTQRQLQVILGLREDTEILTQNFVDHNHDDKLLLMTYKIESHPGLARLRYRADELKLESSRLSRWWTPSFDIYAEYGLYTFRERDFDLSSERKESVFGARLTFQLFDKMTMTNEALQKGLEAMGIQHQHSQSLNELQVDIENAKSELKLNHDLIHESEEALKLAKVLLSRTLDEYRRGVKNSPDVLAATTRNFEIKRRFAELRRDYQIARSELLNTLDK